MPASRAQRLLIGSISFYGMKPAGGIKLITMRNLTFALVLVSAAMQVFAAEAPAQELLGIHDMVLRGHFTDSCLIRSYTPGKCFCCLDETDLDFHQDDESKAK
jgi:hypothetical protein